MEVWAHVENPDSVKVTVIADMTVWELRKVIEQMDKITHAEPVCFFIFRGHLQRVLDRMDTAVFSNEREEAK